MLKNQLDIGISNSLLRVLVIIHFGAIIAAWLSNVPWYLGVPVTFFCLFSLYYCMIQYGFRIGRNAIICIKPNGDGTWLLKSHGGNTWEATLCGDSLKTTFLIILNFKVAGRWSIIPVVIGKDAVSETVFRQLRVQLWVHV